MRQDRNHRLSNYGTHLNKLFGPRYEKAFLGLAVLAILIGTIGVVAVGTTQTVQAFHNGQGMGCLNAGPNSQGNVSSGGNCVGNQTG